MKRIISVLMFTFTVLFSIQSVSFSQKNEDLHKRMKEMQEMLQNRTPEEAKIGGGLFYKISKYKKKIEEGKTKKEAQAEFDIKSIYCFDSEDRLLIIVRIPPDKIPDHGAGITAEAQIRSLNGRIERNDMELNGLIQIVAWVPVESITELAKNPTIGYITTPSTFKTRSLPVTTVGDIQLKANDIRARSGIDGLGIKIGVISDGATNCPAAIAAGELENVTILSQGSGDEGTAMLEIIHDIAPKAELYFSGIGGMPRTMDDFKQRVVELEDRGCNIIVDDIWDEHEPFFTDENNFGAAIRNFIANNPKNVYISAAGNESQQVYDGRTAFSNNLNGYNSFGGKD